MTRSDRLVIVAMFVMLFIVMVLQAGIYWNTRPPEEYETIIVEGTVNTTALEEAGYISVNGGFLERSDNFTIEIEGYIEVEEDTGFRRGPCKICEAIQSGEITPTSWLEESDNFTIIMKDRTDELSEPALRLYETFRWFD